MECECRYSKLRQEFGSLFKIISFGVLVFDKHLQQYNDFTTFKNSTTKLKDFGELKGRFGLLN